MSAGIDCQTHLLQHCEAALAMFESYMQAVFFLQGCNVSKMLVIPHGWKPSLLILPYELSGSDQISCYQHPLLQNEIPSCVGRIK